VLRQLDDLALVPDVLELIQVNELLLAHHFHDTENLGRGVIAKVNVRKGTNANRADALELAQLEVGDHAGQAG
jgi:hypothetical protein